MGGRRAAADRDAGRAWPAAAAPRWPPGGRRRRPFQAGRGYAMIASNRCSLFRVRWAVHTPSSQLQRGTCLRVPAAESGRGFGGSGLRAPRTLASSHAAGGSARCRAGSIQGDPSFVALQPVARPEWVLPPHRRFSRARRMISSRASGSILGRPRRHTSLARCARAKPRTCDPSDLTPENRTGHRVRESVQVRVKGERLEQAEALRG